MAVAWLEQQGSSTNQVVGYPHSFEDRIVL